MPYYRYHARAYTVVLCIQWVGECNTDSATSTWLLPAQQIAPGVYIPNTIAHSDKIKVPVLNTNENMTIVNSKLENGSDIQNYDIYFMEKDSKQKNDRKAIVR